MSVNDIIVTDIGKLGVKVTRVGGGVELNFDAKLRQGVTRKY